MGLASWSSSTTKNSSPGTSFLEHNTKMAGRQEGNVSVSVSASYCIPQCVKLIAGVCTHYVVYNISKKKNTVDKSKIKDKRKVKPKDKSWVKIGWRTKNRKGWCVQKR